MGTAHSVETTAASTLGCDVIIVDDALHPLISVIVVGGSLLEGLQRVPIEHRELCPRENGRRSPAADDTGSPGRRRDLNVRVWFRRLTLPLQVRRFRPTAVAATAALRVAVVPRLVG